MTYAIDMSQRRAARVVGVAYLFSMAAGIFGESYVRGTLIAGSDALLTAQNILAHKALFRVGILAELLVCISDLSLITALYVILTPINRHLATYAAFLRLAALTVIIVMVTHSFDVLRILGSAEYLQSFEGDQLAALARLSLSAHSDTFGVAFVFLGLGSTVFAWLWLKSNYVPKAFGVLGIVASLMLAVGTLTTMLVPGASRVLGMYHMVPMFFFEVGIGLWLLVKGLPRTVDANSAEPVT